MYFSAPVTSGLIGKIRDDEFSDSDVSHASDFGGLAIAAAKVTWVDLQVFSSASFGHRRAMGGAVSVLPDSNARDSKPDSPDIKAPRDRQRDRPIGDQRHTVRERHGGIAAGISDIHHEGGRTAI